MGLGPFGENKMEQQKQQSTAKQQYGFYQQAQVKVVIVLYHKIDQGQDPYGQPGPVIDLEGQQDDHQGPRQGRGKEGGQEGQHTEDICGGPALFLQPKGL